uniref:Uncharacterized protein n=1 Tax=Tetradesmus obliquus TaxID=3088 RepID=A0A383VFQ4_TETOB|eukprot:jgi/Sobl393_1/19278/SZX63216.1
MHDERPRPEDAGDASLYYDKSEATRYHTCQEVVQKQLELTARALEFLGLSAEQHAAAGGSSRPLIADIGCGEAPLLLDEPCSLNGQRCAWLSELSGPAAH